MILQSERLLSNALETSTEIFSQDISYSTTSQFTIFESTIHIPNIFKNIQKLFKQIFFSFKHISIFHTANIKANHCSIKLPSITQLKMHENKK